MKTLFLVLSVVLSVQASAQKIQTENFRILDFEKWGSNLRVSTDGNAHWTANLDGSGDQLYKINKKYYDILWPADNKDRLVLVEKKYWNDPAILTAVDLKTGKETKLNLSQHPKCERFSISPNGSQISFLSDEELYIFEVDSFLDQKPGAFIHKIASPVDPDGKITSARWSPDGNQILFVEYKKVASKDYYSHYVWDTRTDGVTFFVDHEASLPVQWLNGDRFGILLAPKWHYDGTVYTVSRGGGNLTEILPKARYDYRFSPDGNYLFFNKDSGFSDPHSYIKNLKTGKVVTTSAHIGKTMFIGDDFVFSPYRKEEIHSASIEDFFTLAEEKNGILMVSLDDVIKKGKTLFAERKYEVYFKKNPDPSLIKLHPIQIEKTASWIKGTIKVENLTQDRTFQLLFSSSTQSKCRIADSSGNTVKDTSGGMAQHTMTDVFLFPGGTGEVHCTLYTDGLTGDYRFDMQIKDRPSTLQSMDVTI